MSPRPILWTLKNALANVLPPGAVLRVYLKSRASLLFRKYLRIECHRISNVKVIPCMNPDWLLLLSQIVTSQYSLVR